MTVASGASGGFLLQDIAGTSHSLGIRLAGTTPGKLYLAADSIEFRKGDNTAKGLWDTSGLSIGNGGTAIAKHLSSTATLTFGTITALTSSEQDITVTGAAVGDNCYATPQADPGANVAWSCYVKAANKVTVRMTAVATSVTTDRTWRADVWQH